MTLKIPGIIPKAAKILMTLAVILIVIKRSWIFCGGIVFTTQSVLLLLGVAYLAYTLVPTPTVEVLFGFLCLLFGMFYLREQYPVSAMGGILVIAGVGLLEEHIRALIVRKEKKK